MTPTTASLRRRSFRLRILCVLLASLLSGAAQAGQPVERFQSGPQQVSLIELYTSEGCSSCPPADRWLSELQGAKALWSSVVPVAFHVSYWDRLGWPDRFAQRQFDTRQRKLAARADAGVYTPGMFRNGAEFRAWRRTSPTALDNAFNLQTRFDGNPGVLELTSTDVAGEWQLHFTPAANPAALPERAYVALLGNNLSNEIRRGENAGRTLEHNFVVLSLAESPLSKGSEGSNDYSASFRLPRVATGTPAIAAWVADAQQRPIQAVGGALNQSVTN